MDHYLLVKNITKIKMYFICFKQCLLPTLGLHLSYDENTATSPIRFTGNLFIRRERKKRSIKYVSFIHHTFARSQGLPGPPLLNTGAHYPGA